MKSQDLRKALEAVKPGLASKELMEQATSVMFRKDSLWTFNDEVAVTAPLETGIEGAAPGAPLYAFLSKLKPDSEVSLELGENELKISSGRNRAGILLDPDIKLPLDEELELPKRFKAFTKELEQAINMALFSASRSGHIPILTCVHFTDSFVETCDEYRMTRCPAPAVSSNSDLIIVAKGLERIGAYKPIKVGQSKTGWVHFLNGEGVRYCVRSAQGEYPNLDKFLEVSGQEIEFPENLSEALDWASIVADDSVKYEQSVSVSIGKTGLTVKGKGPYGWAEQTIRMRYTGNPINFDSHPSFLKEMTKLASKVTVGENSLKVEGEGFIHVVSLNSGS